MLGKAEMPRASYRKTRLLTERVDIFIVYVPIIQNIFAVKLPAGMGQRSF